MPLPKKPLPNINRQPQGVPVGGQFAPTTHAEPDISLPAERAPRSIALPDIPLPSGGSGGSSALPPLPPNGGGSGGSNDDAEREASISLMSRAVRKHAEQLVNRLARTINISARENGTLRFDDVLDRNGRSIDDEYGSLAQSLTGDVNANRVGGGISAQQILGTEKSAAIDAVALFDGELKVVGPGKPPRY